MKKSNHFARRSFMVFAGLALALFIMGTSCSKDDDNPPDIPEDQVIMFEGTATLSSGSVQSNASGSVTAKFDPATDKLSYTFTWQGLTGTIGGFHIHKGDGAIIINFKDANYPTTASGTFSGSAVLTNSAWIDDLKAGNLYGQIHTAQYPAGEIQFPFAKKSSGNSGGNNDGNNDGGNNDGGGYDDGY